MRRNHGSHDRRERPFERPKGRPDARGEAEGRPHGVIYGLLPVIEALRAEKRRVDRVLIAEGAREHRLSEVIDLCRERSIAWHKVPRENFNKYVDASSNHQGVIAFAASAEYTGVGEILNRAADPALMLVLDGVEDPRNLGAILRTAECSGVDGVIIPERRAVGLTDTVAKSSAGAIEHVRVGKVGNINRFIEELKESGIWVVGTSVKAEMHYFDWDWTRPSALVLGSEGSGIHRLVEENCDALVNIPMYGKVDSLNVSVAAGVILFEARRQRSAKDK